MAQIVILHGWGRGAKSFNEVKKLLEEKGHEVYSFDLPGFGDEPAPKEPWTIDEYVEYVFSKIDILGLKKFYLLGHSFGGQIAVKFAVKLPETLQGLILYGAAALRPKRTLKQLFFLSAAKTGGVIFSLPLLRYGKKFMTKIIYKLSGSSDYMDASPVMKETMRLVIAEDLKYLLPQIKTPTLLIWGKKDRITPTGDAKIMEQNIKNAKLVILHGKHALHRENPEEFASIINEFVK